MRNKSTIGPVLVCLSMLLACCPTMAEFTSHIDLAPLPRLEEECPKTGAEPLDAQAPHSIDGLIGGATLTYAQGMNNLSALLEASVSSKAIDAMKADARARDPNAAAALAAGAVVKQRPLAVLALLLQAHAAAPDDPVHLINLAGLSNHFGLYREALAMVGEAEKKKFPGARAGGAQMRAVLLSNKGYALNATARPKEAEVALREAIKLDPDLAEAYTNLAYALGDQDRCPLAARYLRAGKTHKPARVLAESDAADKPERLPGSEVIDLSRGKAGLLPGMHIAASPEEADNDALKRHLEKLGDGREAVAAQQRQMKFAEQARARRAAWSQQGAVGAMSGDRAEWLMQLSVAYADETLIALQLAGTPEQVGPRYDRVMMGARLEGEVKHSDPDLDRLVRNSARALLEMIARRENATVRFVEHRELIMRKYNEERNACGKQRDGLLCIRAAELRRDTAICSSAKEAAAQRQGSAIAYAATFRDLYGESYRRLTAVASYFSETAHHEEARARTIWFAHMATNMLANQINGHRAAQAMGAKECRASDKRMVDLLFDYLKVLEAAACKAGGGGDKIGVGVVEVGANCEEISVTAATPGWLGLFVKVGYEQSKRYEFVKAGKERFLAQQAGLDPHIKLHVPEHGAAFDGKLTVYAGGQVKAEAGGVGADAKAGGYIEFNGKWDITGYGRQTEVSASGSVSPGGGVSAGGERQIYQSKTPLFSPSHANEG